MNEPRYATRKEAMAAIFRLAGGWGSEDDAAIVSYITWLELRIAHLEGGEPRQEPTAIADGPWAPR